MKILMVNKFLYPNGGSETYIFKLGEYITSIGHEVQYFGMEDERNIVGNKVGSYTSNMNFHGNYLTKLIYPFKIIYSFEARKKIRQVLNDFKPDVVHLNNFNFQITPSIIYEIKKDKLPIIFTAHDYQLVCPNHMLYDLKTKGMCNKCLDGNYANCLKNKCVHGSVMKSILGMMEATLYKMLHTYRKIDKIICPSQFLERKLVTNKDLKSKTVAIHNFIDLVEAKEVVKEDYILYFGRFSEEKGIKNLIKVCKELPYIKFVFAGSGPLEEELSGITNIKNIGFQHGQTLEDIIRKAQFTLYTSEWYENCPFSVMESQMYGTPVIGANIGGIPELIEVGKTGLLFESGNIDDLKDKILTLWNDKVICEEFSKNCLNVNFNTVFDYSEQLLTIYKNC
ncbi:glycosyltransferase [Clostridium lacusfryxellense]|uniref:glycosyltransferase n=1 Tax=Clostridium lacusfryxellense TaxID=205328 RepID=UPI001C0BA058|nr:glycosyltransferase [Clostridium lacusfryxellense]MBU3111073.1 glycosyltransferase [Clostridium lacusfryxellense]